MHSCKRHVFDPWVGKIPWSRKWQPAPVFLPGESHGQRSLVGYSLWGHRESDLTERLRLSTAHSDCCEAVPHWSFHLHLSNNEQCWETFHVAVGHVYVFLFFFSEIHDLLFLMWIARMQGTVRVNSSRWWCGQDWTGVWTQWLLIYPVLLSSWWSNCPVIFPIKALIFQINS